MGIGKHRKTIGHGRLPSDSRPTDGVDGRSNLRHHTMVKERCSESLPAMSSYRISYLLLQESSKDLDHSECSTPHSYSLTIAHSDLPAQPSGMVSPPAQELLCLSAISGRLRAFLVPTQVRHARNTATRQCSGKSHTVRDAISWIDALLPLAVKLAECGFKQSLGFRGK